ncbi:RNA polymerase sigma factor SigZ [Pseudoalteromonas sp. SSDWG2]|uniref:RNA polymerase sigma factor SigZ n=1 Tax=Pseudoalteromonas sp. SSDWG2 TaxID=3139391 RepID=UPI003BA92EA6
MRIEQIWAEYKHSLRSFLRSKIANEADVEELLQEILLKTHLHLHQLKDQRSIKSWLFQIARNTITDFYRQQSHQQDDLLFDVADAPEYSIKADLIKCIEPFLQAMPEAQADLIRKIDLEGHSQKQEAQRLGISYSTLKSRTQKSRAELKILFERCCDFEIDKHGNLIDYHQKPRGKESHTKNIR